MALTRLGHALWPGGLAGVALRIDGASAALACALGLAVVVACPIAASLSCELGALSSGSARSGADLISDMWGILVLGMVIAGLPGGLALTALLVAIDRVGPRYWPETRRAKWRLCLMAPLSAAVPALTLSSLATVVCANLPRGGAGVVWWMGPAAAWWMTVVVLPAAYAVVFVTGIVRAWRRLAAHRPNRCWTCGYSLQGLAPGAVCPECGMKPGLTPEGESVTS